MKKQENEKEKQVVVKKKFKLVKFLIVLLMLYIVGFFIYKLFVAKINNIYISNNINLTDQEVIDISGLRDYPSFLFTTKSTIKNRLLKHDLIKGVKVKKKIWGIIEIEVDENEPLFIYKKTEKVILENTKQMDNNNYILPTITNEIEEDMLNKLVEKYKDIDNEIKLLISEIEYVPNDIDKERFIFTMNDGNYIYITLYKILSINEYIKILPNLENKKGILYLDSGNYFEILK